MSWPRSVRARLALWYALALLAVVSIYAVAVVLQVRDDLYETLDGQLAGDYELAVQWLQQARDARAAAVPESAPLEDGRRTGAPWVDAWSLDGRRLFEAGREPLLSAFAGSPSSWPRRPSTLVLANGDRVRALSGQSQVAGHAVVVRVGRSERFAREELGELAAALGLSLPVAFLVAGAAGYLLARRALAPVSAMTARARQITAERLEERLPVDDPNDEFGQLAIVVNDALARLERSFLTLRRFTADASHELRTPLTAIRSVGEVGLRERRTETEYREMIGSILEEAGRLTTLTDSLLMLSRTDSGKTDLQPTLVSLGDLAKETAEDLEVLAEERQQQITVEADPTVVVMADRPSLRQAVINLLDNAIKYSPANATIRLVVRRGGDDALLEVIDDGPGIAPEHLPHVFERFYRADKARSRVQGGTGLGLSIARWAAEANGGRIEVESELSRGSAFRIVLPAAR